MKMDFQIVKSPAKESNLDSNDESHFQTTDKNIENHPKSHLRINDPNEVEKKSSQKTRNSSFLIGLMKACSPFAVLIIAYILLYISLNSSESEYNLPSLKKGEIYILNCSSFTEMTNSFKAEESNENFSNASSIYSIIITNNSEKSITFAFIKSNMAKSHLINIEKMDRTFISSLFYLIIESSIDSGEILNVKYPSHVSEEDMILSLPYARAFLVNKKAAEQLNGSFFHENDYDTFDHSVQDDENGRKLETFIKNKGLNYGTLTSENLSINTLIAGVEGKTNVKQFFEKNSRKLTKTQIKHHGFINFLTDDQNLKMASNFYHEINVDVKTIEEKIDHGKIDFVLKIVENQTFFDYSEKNREVKIMEKHKNTRKMQSEILYQNYTISDVFGKELSWDFTAFLMDNETCGFRTKMMLKDYFVWDLCEGIYGPETSKRLKQVFAFKNALNYKADQTAEIVYTLTHSQLDEADKLVDDIKSQMLDYLISIEVAFDDLLKNYTDYKTKYSFALNNGRTDFNINDMFINNLTSFGSNQNIYSVQFNNQVKNNVSNFLEISSRLAQKANSRAKEISSQVVNKFKILTDSITVTDKNSLLDYSYFQGIQKTIESQIIEGKTITEIISKKIMNIINQLNEVQDNMKNDFKNKLEIYIQEFNEISIIYKAKVSDNRLIKKLSEKIDLIFNFSETFKNEYNKIVTDLLQLLDNSYKTIPSSFIKPYNYASNTVSAHIKQNIKEEYQLKCKSNNIQITMDIPTQYTKIKTIINIDLPLGNNIVDMFNQVNYVSKDIKLESVLKIKGSNQISTSAYIVKDFIDATIILIILYQIGLSFSKLSFYHLLNVTFTVTRSMYVWKRYSYVYSYRKCNRSRCWRAYATAWSSIFYDTNKNEIAKISRYIGEEKTINWFAETR